MKQNYLKKIFLLLTLFSTCLLFSQGQGQNQSQAIHVYDSNGNEILNGGTFDFGSSTLLDFTIRNIPTTAGNPSLVLSNPEVTLTQGLVSSSDFILYTRPNFNIKENAPSYFKILKINKECGTFTGTVVTIYSNAKNFPIFTFTLSFTNKPSISVLGGTPTQTIPNGQTVPTSVNGTLFGTITSGATATRNYVIVNTGTCPLTLNSLSCFEYGTTTQSPDFAIIALITPEGVPLTTPYTIAPGGTAVLMVRFSAPVIAGTKNAVISITNNDLAKSPYTFVIGAEVYDPSVAGPGGINADFRLWLKANRGINVPSGNKVDVWKDLGSLGKNAEQETPANQPTFVDAASTNINFNPVVQFVNDGTSSLNQFLYNKENGYYTHETFIVMEPDGAIGAPMTIISGTSAIKPTALTDPYPIVVDEHSGIGLGNLTSRLSNEKLWFNQKQTTSTPYYTVADALGDYTKAGIINTRNKTATASDGIDLLFNSNPIGNQTSISPSFTYTNLGYDDAGLWKGTPYNIGKNFNEPTYGNLKGRVAEVISYASLVPVTDRPKIETYLALKYGITLGNNGQLGLADGTVKDYIDSGNHVIWDRTANAPYNYNIAGIGKDVASDLYQKQSKSGNDVNAVTIGLGEIAATNNLNINEFKKDRDFLVWGSNNGTFAIAGTNSVTIAPEITTTFNRINKKWKIVESKSDVDGDVGNVFVGIPNNAINVLTKSATEEYVLIVSENDTFNNSDIIDVIPLKPNGTTWQTWYDFDDTKYFTFGVAQRKEVKQLVKSTVGTLSDKDFLVGEYALNLKSGAFTVGCWIRNDGASTAYRTIFGKGNELQIRLNDEHKVEACWDGVPRFTSVTAVADDKWHYVVGVYYYGAADLYIDGVKDNASFNLQNPSPNFNRFSVGALYVDKKNIINPFLGEIDQIHIWDMPLNANQINYLMNQEMEKYSDGKVSGKIVPHNITKNEMKAIDWSLLVAYYDFNAFYGTTVEGLTAERNFLRIKYLNKNKQLLNTQTAPLPYETVADGLWDTAATWKNGSIQTIPNSTRSVTKIVNSVPTTVTYPIDGNIVKINHNVTSTGNKTVLGLFVEGTDATTYKALSANSDTKVEVSHYLKLDGLINLEGRSQLVQTLNSDLDPLSIGFIKRDQQGTVNKYNYNYWSSPVGPINGATNNNSYTVKDVFKDGTTVVPQTINWVSGLDGNKDSPIISLALRWLYKFENGFEYADWKPIIETDQINPAQGFIIKGAGAVPQNLDNVSYQNYTFVGKPYNGLIESNKVLNDNLFLVGNPYPSALNAFEFIKDNISVASGGNNTQNVIDGTLYFWQHAPLNNTHYLAGYTGGYATLTLTGEVLSYGLPVKPTGIADEGDSKKFAYQYIPVGQGFFVNGSTDITNPLGEKIIFNNNQRAFVKENSVDDLSAPISNTLFKNSNANGKSKIVDHFNDNSNDAVYNNYNTKIRLGSNTVNNFHRQLLLGFMNEDATDGFDIGYDGYQIDTQDNDVYFLIDDWEYTVQGVGYFDVNKTYPLGVKADTIGTVKFMVDATEFLPANTSIQIHDKETATFYDITKDTVEVNLAPGTYNSRFELTFKTEKSAIVAENELPESTLLIYNNDVKKKLFMTKHKEIVIMDVSVYNILGQLLISVEKIADSDTIEIPFNVASGAYIVKVNTDKGTVSQKILKQ